jgi:hypothetical protein
MAIIELSLKETYVPGWGSWECIREIIQNGLDEKIRGHELTVKHKGGRLIVHNRGSDMTTEALLMGHTDKADNDDLIGEHGEGLDVGILAGIRCGYEIKITTRTETWVPFLDHSETYKARVLKVRTRKLQKPSPGVTVEIKMPREDWEGVRNLFLPLAGLNKDKDLIGVERMGAIITHPDYRGRIYVKGIWVQNIDDLEYGYNLLGFRLDRDRRIIDTFEFKWKLADMYRSAISKRPDFLLQPVYAMLRDDKLDTQGLKYTSDNDLCNLIADQFLAEHGESAVPVASIGESSTVSKAGRTGVVVNDTLKEVLAKSRVDTATKVKQDLDNAVSKTYSWDDLAEEERAVLMAAAAALDAILPTTFPQDIPHRPILDVTKVVDFFRENLVGKVLDGDILLARKNLTSPAETLTTLVHEKAHEISGAGDGMQAHVATLEALWSALYWQGKCN